jgi:CHASE3 domain sensor protein
MPGKARRVASRQAQLNRNKRQQRGPSGIPAVEATADTEDQPSAEEATSQANGVVTSSEATAAAPAATAAARAPRPAGPGRLRREHVASANYIGAELRRILIMGSVILVVLIVLGITV